MTMLQQSSTTNLSRSPPIDGKVLRLHFACYAELPLGSSLRVTSSDSLSATSSSISSTASTAAAARNESLGYDYDDDLSKSNLYTSSVEMVTTPETYPLWRTRTPVIRVVNIGGEQATGTGTGTNTGTGTGTGTNTGAGAKTGSTRVKDEREGVFLHRYRYLVVSPGNKYSTSSGSLSSFGSITGAIGQPNRMMTSDGIGGVVEVDKFENPFQKETAGCDGNNGGVGNIGGDEDSNSLMDDDTTVHTRQDEQKQQQQDVPFRTLAIDVSSGNSNTFGKVLSTATTTTAATANTANTANTTTPNVQFTEDGIQIDHWNQFSDLSFQPYKAYLEAVQKATAHIAALTAPSSHQKDKKGAWASTSESDSDAFTSQKKRSVNKSNLHDISTTITTTTTTTTSTGAVETSIQEKDQTQGTTATTTSTATATTSSPLPSPLPSPSSTKTSTPSRKRIFLVCYHLPIILKKDKVTGDFTAKFSESLLAKTEQSGVSKSYDTGWIGTVSLDLKTDEEKDAVRQVLKPLNCMPIFLEKELRNSFYYGMCKQVLWPAFHNIDLLDISKSGWGNKGISDAPDANNWDQSRLDGWWDAYCQVNGIFRTTLMTILKPHDKIWVHDYHLSLLPKLLHESEVDSVTGERTIQMVYFLHIPFPTSQVFRELEHGGEILEGMLHADVVGFHAFDHARHFLNAGKRILGLTHESLVGGLIGVRHRGTKVLVTISNVSIETDVVQRTLESESVSKGMEVIKTKFNERKIIAGVDVAQGLSGISLKLLAYERMLSDYPQWVGNVVLMQRNLIPSVRKADEVDTLNHVRHLVNRLKTNFGADCIDYDEIYGSSLPIAERLALWSCSDVFMSASIREGLNLLPLEYVYTKSTNPGVTLISEFSAMSSILNGALRVNPYDVKLAATILEQALSMSVEEKTSRRERDIHFVSTSPSGQWTRNVLRDLHDVKLATAIDDKPSKSALLAGAKMESVTSETGCSTLLNPSSVTSAYNFCEKRVIFVDFNGTIVMKEPPGKFFKREMLGIAGNKPPDETIKALTELCADERNVVFVVSGDTEANIENAIGNIPGLGLAAGNGGSISLPLKLGETSRKWEAIDQGVDWEAVVKITMQILSKYTARANGAFVKHTSSSIGWSYYGCDPEWGEILATHLVIELQAALNSFDIRLVKLKGVVEVVPRKLNKGQIVRRVLKDHGADFILCMGDDVSDEKMFTSVFSVLAESNANESMNGEQEASHVFTVTVGEKASNASYYVENAQDVADLLVDMSGVRRRLGRAMSWDNEDLAPDMFA